MGTATKGGVDGYESIDTPWTKARWAGLEHGGTYSLMDGTVNARGWHYAIASGRSWKGGFPGAGSVEKKVELYAFFSKSASPTTAAPTNSPTVAPTTPAPTASP